MKKLLIFGTGLIAEIANFYFENDSEYDVVAFTNSKRFIESEEFLGKPLIPFETLINSHSPNEYHIFIAISYTKTNEIRKNWFLKVKSMGYKCATYISSNAVSHHTDIGENCLVLEANVIQPYVKLGDNVFLWSGNHVGHHSIIEDHCFISSHVVISGNCKIRQNCFIGVNATLRDGIEIGSYSVIGASASVMKSCGERSLVQSPKSTITTTKFDLI